MSHFLYSKEESDGEAPNLQHQFRNINFVGAVRVCRAFAPGMVTEGWRREVLTGSEDAMQPYTVEIPCNAAKGSVLDWPALRAPCRRPRHLLGGTPSPPRDLVRIPRV